MALPPLFLDPHPEEEATAGFLSGPSRKKLTYPNSVIMLGDRDLLWMYEDKSTTQVNETTVRRSAVAKGYTDATDVLDDANKFLRPAIRLRPYQTKDVGKSSVENKTIEYEKYDVYVAFAVQGSVLYNPAGIAYYDDKILRGVVSSSNLPATLPEGCLRDHKPKKRCLDAMQPVMTAAAPIRKQLSDGLVPHIWNDEDLRSEGAKIWLEFVTRALEQASSPAVVRHDYDT